MAARTSRFGFNKFGGGIPGTLTDDGGKFTSSDRDTLDRVLAAYETHNHHGGVRLADPTEAPILSLTTSSGTLAAGTTYFYRCSFIDQFGLETAASPEISLTTPSPLSPPGAPAMVTAPITDSNPGVKPGITYYALSSISGTDETGLGAYGVVSVASDQRQVTITFPTVPTGVASFGIWRKGPNEAGYTKIGAATAVSAGTFIDEGTVSPSVNPLDPSTAPSSLNLTNSTNTITITSPNTSLVGADPSSIKKWRIYRSRTSGVYSGTSLVAEVTQTVNEDGSGGLVTAYADDGTITPATGAPNNYSQTLLPAVIQSFTAIDDITTLPDATGLADGSVYIVELAHTQADLATNGIADNAIVFVVQNGVWVPTGNALLFYSMDTPSTYLDVTHFPDGYLGICYDSGVASVWAVISGAWVQLTGGIGASTITFDASTTTFITSGDVQDALVELDAAVGNNELAWYDVILSGTWATFASGTDLQASVDRAGNVHLRGAVAGGAYTTGSSVIGVLSARSTPDKVLDFIAYGVNTSTPVLVHGTIGTDGTITIDNGLGSSPTTKVSFDTVVFVNGWVQPTDDSPLAPTLIFTEGTYTYSWNSGLYTDDIASTLDSVYAGRWFSFQGGTTDVVLSTVGTTGHDVDTVIAVYDQIPTPSTTHVAFDDDSGSSHSGATGTSYLSFTPVNGTVYYAVVGQKSDGPTHFSTVALSLTF